MCGKRRSHAQHALFPRFLHLEFAVAQTGIALRSEPNLRHLGKQTGRPGLPTKPFPGNGSAPPKLPHRNLSRFF